MALILAIEGDPKQAALLKCVVRNHVGAALVVVHSKDEAIAAIGAGVPDLILLSALLSPREEEEVVAHLRTLNCADHLQTLTLPRIAGSTEDEAPRGLLAAFRRKRPAKRPAGCDPRQFAEEIVQYLQRAEEIKAECAARDEAAEFTAKRAERTERFTAESAETGPVLTAESAETGPVLTAESAETRPGLTAESAVIAASSMVDPSGFSAPSAADSSGLSASSAVEPCSVSASSAVDSPGLSAPSAVDSPGHSAPSAVGSSVFSVHSAVTSAGSERPAPPRRAPLAMWAKVDSAGVSPREPMDQTVPDEIRALMRSLRIPGQLADLDPPHGCRIRRVWVERRSPAGQRAPIVARASA